MKNRFNKLSSKEWLPFQKSWFKFHDWKKVYKENINFFTKAENENEVIYYNGPHLKIAKEIVTENHDKIVQSIKKDKIQFALIDLMEKINPNTTPEQYKTIKADVIKSVQQIYPLLLERRFISIIIPNIELEGRYFPYAWDLAKEVSSIYSLKDEKIGCFVDEDEPISNSAYFHTNKKVFYCLYFRKDENSPNNFKENEHDFFENIKQQNSDITFDRSFPSWFILKPKPRKKDEILHPAKYPEDLVDMCVQHFTVENDNVFDPMSGTGSTQLGALKNKRNGYGTELSEFFAGIAIGRCEEYLEPTQMAMFAEVKEQNFKILCKDARSITDEDFPKLDYILTSPPYWDMLNMKGAENQAKRLEKGLQTNYSSSDKDFGNISDYNTFVQELAEIYFKLSKFLKPGGYFTIVVKNIKKQGSNYPFAWDLSMELQKKLILLPEFFWCQDDISIAPYGYGNTWVSNTFHQYCLNFQKPL
jgi:DNA modification methylase